MMNGDYRRKSSTTGWNGPLHSSQLERNTDLLSHQSRYTNRRNEDNGILGNFRLGFGPAPPPVTTPPPPRFRCEDCGDRFFARDDLEVHKLTAHHKEVTSTTPPYGTFLYSIAQPLAHGWDGCLMQSRLGKFRGIQGENNSCYLDSTLMAMFYANDTYDDLLAAPKQPSLRATTMNQDVEYARLYLTMHIVNNLRRRGFVPSMLVLEWRRMISPFFGAGVDFDSYCAEEEACEFAGFLQKAFGEGVHSTQFTVVQGETVTGQSAKTKRKPSYSPKKPIVVPEAQTMMQLLPPPEERGSPRFIWNMETLVNYTLESQQLRFSELNSSLILQLPRYGKRDRVIGAVAPDTHLHLYSGLPAQETKTRFELRALVVIGTSHFVTYLRVKNRSTRSNESCRTSATGIEVTHAASSVDAPCEHSWLFYDSMSDRDSHQNIPVIEDVTADLSILEYPNAAALVAQEMNAPNSSSHLRRVVEDMSLAFYSRVDEHENERMEL